MIVWRVFIVSLSKKCQSEVCNSVSLQHHYTSNYHCTILIVILQFLLSLGTSAESVRWEDPDAMEPPPKRVVIGDLFMPLSSIVPAVQPSDILDEECELQVAGMLLIFIYFVS